VLLTGRNRREARRNDDDDRVDLTDGCVPGSVNQLLSRVCRSQSQSGRSSAVDIVSSSSSSSSSSACWPLLSVILLSSLPPLLVALLSSFAFVVVVRQPRRRLETREAKIRDEEYQMDGIRVNARIFLLMPPVISALYHSFIFHPPLPIQN